jgi:hypothetical protein
MVLLYILLPGLLAALAADMRHLQSTVITLEQRIPGAAGILAQLDRGQGRACVPEPPGCRACAGRGGALSLPGLCSVTGSLAWIP